MGKASNLNWLAGFLNHQQYLLLSLSQKSLGTPVSLAPFQPHPPTFHRMKASSNFQLEPVIWIIRGKHPCQTTTKTKHGMEVIYPKVIWKWHFSTFDSHVLFDSCGCKYAYPPTKRTPTHAKEQQSAFPFWRPGWCHVRSRNWILETSPSPVGFFHTARTTISCNRLVGLENVHTRHRTFIPRLSGDLTYHKKARLAVGFPGGWEAISFQHNWHCQLSIDGSLFSKCYSYPMSKL